MDQIPVTWGALIFTGGLVCGTVAWTFWFWSAIDARIDRIIRQVLKERGER